MPDPLRQTVSASQTAALFNASPYLTPWLLYRELKFGEEVPREETNRMDWGKRLEPLLITAAADDLKLEVIPNRGPDGKQIYVRNGVLGASRDARVICPDRGPGALEIKYVSDYGVWMREWEGGKKPPRHVEIQLQTQMCVGEDGESWKWGTIGAFCGAEMFYFERKPINELWAAMEAEAAEMLRRVGASEEPDPTGAVVEVPLIQKIFAPTPENVLDMRQDEAGIEWSRKVQLMKHHAAERLGNSKAEEKIKAELKGLMKDNGLLLLPFGVQVKAKAQKRASYTVGPSQFTVLDAFVPENMPDDPIFSRGKTDA